MGGAVAVEAAEIIPNVVGLCVIDVVEGSALESLSAMQSILRGRPTSFQSLEHAIQWRYIPYNSLKVLTASNCDQQNCISD